MQYLTLKAGATSQIVNVFIRDLSDNNGLGKTAVAWNTATLTASYTRAGAAPVAITLATQTPTGAFSSGGFCLYDDTTAPGLYRLDVPNAALVAGVTHVDVCIQGVADASPEQIRIQLSPNVNVDSFTTGAIATTSFTAGAIDAAAIGVGAIAADAFAAGAIDAAAIANGAIDAATFAAGAIDAAALAADATTEIWNKAMVEPTAPPAVTGTAINGLSWLLALARNKITTTATTTLVKADDGSTTIGTSTISDDGTTFTRGEFA